jgi:hypothetical protein
MSQKLKDFTVHYSSFTAPDYIIFAVKCGYQALDSFH